MQHKVMYYEERTNYKSNASAESELVLVSLCETEDKSVAAGFLRALADKIDPPKPIHR